MNEIQSIFIANLKKARSAARMTQATLAEHCGLSAFYISELETGRRFPSAETLQTICDILELRPYQLFFSQEDGKGLHDQVNSTLYLEQVKEKVIEAIDSIAKSSRS